MVQLSGSPSWTPTCNAIIPCSVLFFSISLKMHAFWYPFHWWLMIQGLSSTGKTQAQVFGMSYRLHCPSWSLIVSFYQNGICGRCFLLLLPQSSPLFQLEWPWPHLLLPERVRQTLRPSTMYFFFLLPLSFEMTPWYILKPASTGALIRVFNEYAFPSCNELVNERIVSCLINLGHFVCRPPSACIC